MACSPSTSVEPGKFTVVKDVIEDAQHPLLKVLNSHNWFNAARVN